MPLSRTTRRGVLAGCAVAFVAGAVYLWWTGSVTPTSVQAWLASLGPGAPAIFILAFIGGAFVGLPGMAFVVGARLAFGPYLGFVAAYTGGMLAVAVPFFVARRVRPTGGTPWRPAQRHLARAFELLATHPFRAILALRLVLWFNPPLSYALAFTPTRATTYLAACALALAPVVASAMIATGWFL